MSSALRIRYVHMFDKHGSRTTTEPMIIRLKICSHGQDKTDFFIFLFSQNFAQHCIMQNKPKGTGHPNVFDHRRKITKFEGTMMAKFTMWEILRLGFVSHESKCSPEHFW